MSNGDETLNELPTHYREALDEDEQRFLLAWVKAYRDNLSLQHWWEERLELSPEEARKYKTRILRKLHKRTSSDLIKECLKAMGWWPPPKPSWWRPRSQ